MQIIEHSIIGTRSAVLRMHRRGTALEFVIFPMMHVASPEFYREVTKRLKQCDLLVVEGVGGAKGSAKGSALTAALTLTYRVMPLFRRGRLVEDPIRYGALGLPFIRPDVSTAEVGEAFSHSPMKFRLLLLLFLPVAMIVNLVGARRQMLSPSVEVNDLPDPQDEEFAASEFGDQFERLTGGERDDRVISALAELVAGRGGERIDVGVVYGAGHTAKIVDALHRLGYRLRPSDWIMLFPA